MPPIATSLVDTPIRRQSSSGSRAMPAAPTDAGRRGEPRRDAPDAARRDAARTLPRGAGRHARRCRRRRDRQTRRRRRGDRRRRGRMKAASAPAAPWMIRSPRARASSTPANTSKPTRRGRGAGGRYRRDRTALPAGPHPGRRGVSQAPGDAIADARAAPPCPGLAKLDACPGPRRRQRSRRTSASRRGCSLRLELAAGRFAREVRRWGNG